MQLTDVIEWAKPTDIPPPNHVILAVVSRRVTIGYPRYDKCNSNYYILNPVRLFEEEGIIEWWAELPKTPDELENEEDAYFLQCNE